MDTLRADTLLLDLPRYNQLLCQYDPHHAALWCYLNPSSRPCFTTALLAEIRNFQKFVATYLRASPDAAKHIRYVVYASATPRVFNLGGDVELFTTLIAERNRDGLYEYGRACVDAVFANATSFGIPTLTTIALVQGAALGGGLEGALSCNVVIAEEGAQMGFPETLFNLFPGMGAMSLLARRIDSVRAERLIQNGDIGTGRTLWEMGVVDELAPDGEGVRATNDFIRRHERFANGRLALRQARERVAPLSYQELIDILEIWVEAALRLTPRDLRVMRRIVTAQQRLDRFECAPQVEVIRSVGVATVVPDIAHA